MHIRGPMGGACRWIWGQDGEEESRITGFWLQQLGRWVMLFAEMGKRDREGRRINLFQFGHLNLRGLLDSR